MRFNPFPWRSLKTRVTLFTLISFLIGIWSLAFYASHTLRRDMGQSLGEQQLATVSIIAAAINDHLEDRLKALEMVAAIITPATLGNAAAMQRVLEERPALQAMFNGGLWVARLDGTAIADVPISAGRIGVNYSDREWVAETYRGKSIIGTPVIGRRMKAPLIPIAAPIRDAKGNVIGLLTGSINLGAPNVLERVIGQNYRKTGSYLVVSRRIRTIVYATDKRRIMEPLPAPGVSPMIDRYLQGHEGHTIAADPLGVEVLASAKGIPVAGWSLVALMPTQEAFAPIHALQKRVLMATILLSLLAAGLTRWLLKRQIAPLFATIETLTALSDRDRPPPPLPITRRDEIGQLIEGFNRLLETLRKREEALSESERQYRSLASSVDSMYLVDRECRFLLVNEQHLKRFGLPAEQVIGRKHGDFHTAEASALFEKYIQRVFETGMPHQDEYRSARDGHYFVRTLSPVKDDRGRTSSVTVVAKDITDRMRMEESLKTSEEKYIKTFQSNPACVGLSRMADGLVIEANKALLDLLGYGRDEFIGHSIVDLGVWDDPADREKLVKGLKEEGRSMHKEFRLRTRTGALLHCDHCADILEIGGESYIIFTFIDITERKRAEEERRSLQERLQRAEKMEALGQMAGGVAHDLNNVLGILSGYSELLLDEIPSGNSARVHVEKILQSTEKGAAIIQDLLTLARRGVMASAVINLNRVVADYLQTPVFENLRGHHPWVTFRTGYDPNLPNIRGSSVHLEKTLMNLVANAAEAVSGKGEVTIRTEGRYLDRPLQGYDEVKEGNYAVLIVSDTGIGIPAESRKKIFEPFYTKKTMDRSGTGLGLAIVWGTVRDHHGYIDLETKVDEGTTFTLYFPVTKEEMIAQQQRVPIERYMGNGESVLVVDDIPEQREIAARLLTRLGYRVHLASSGEEAVEYLKENRAEILVLDMIMTPGIDGLETYRRVLRISPRQKAIIVSGFSETERVREAQKLGAGAYVKKPYIMETIGVAIRETLTR